jgi:tRNA G46 methylase TrmB
MTVSELWKKEYLEEKFSKPDPWNYLTSPYEQQKYHRQMDAIIDRYPNPGKILEIGSAEGAHTSLLAKRFPNARIIANRDLVPGHAKSNAEHRAFCGPNRAH